jgi:hypothetical protein
LREKPHIRGSLDQKASAIFHTNKSKRPTKLLQKALFCHFVWEIEKSIVTNDALPLWPIPPASHHFKKIYIPLKMYLKSLAILGIASISLKKSFRNN